MKSGRILKSFTAENGRHVVLRTPKWEDLDDLLELINSLVEEKADIIRTEKVSRDDEVGWLAGALTRLEKDETFYVVAEVDGQVVGNSEVARAVGGYERHVGVLGIAIKNGYRDIGIGTEMMKMLIEQSKTMGLKVLVLNAFATNKRAIHVYEKAGFVRTGIVPKKFFKDNEFIDEITMTRLLE
ncbi:MAG: GNAT family protein [Candidatus Bathyarchaeota archaeon]|jgi:RimJ/RimL family protein N-acetyltransferase|nr:GNAT family protein [Candidatus Bathyarchaeota archaeon]